MEGLIIPPPTWRPSNGEYHEHPSWSPSRLKVFRESPEKARRLYVTGEMEKPDASRAMAIGSLVGIFLLEPHLADSIYVHEHKTRSEKLRLFQEERPELFVVTSEEMSTAKAVAKAILEPRTRAARAALALLREIPGYSEYAHCWEDEYGVPRKSKVDRLAALGLLGAVIEVKTARNPEPEAFARQADQLDYDLQAASNIEGATKVLGEEPVLIWVVVGNEEPYDVAPPQIISPEFLELGRRKLRSTLERLGRCLRGECPWEAEWQELGETFPMLKPPAWKMRGLELPIYE